ncbi:hypothetical protein B0H14DRAFT_2356350 [Mycena olivaceomarginata]|nr:hypothetical protein B0H14DRAFT_2356350 [Mycena olivaceomarginata]
MSLDLFLLLVILFVILLHRQITHIAPIQNSNGKKPCRRCGKPTSLRCSRCHEAYYCSPEHMTSDWQTHKSACRKSFDALLFPVDSTIPTMIKIPYTSKIDDDGAPVFAPKPYHALDSQVLNQYVDMIGMKHVRKFGSYGPPLERPLVVIYSDNWSGLSKNQCIAELTGGKMGVQWAGNVLVLRQKGELYAETYESARTEDMVAMKRFFEEYRDFVPYAF